MTASASLDVVPRSITTLEIEQRHAHIDRELAALAESMRVLRSRKNDLVYSSRLPPEILATIFIYVVEEESCTGTPSLSGAPLCLAVTHVCRYWRQVALECPTLWTYINCASVHWVAIMLERSKKSALVVTYRARGPLPQYVEQVLLQLHRIKVLKLSLCSFGVKHILGSLTSQPAPLLQIFKFSAEGAIRPRIDTIFQGHAPQLRSVELIYCNFSWILSSFSGLRTLEVREMVFSSHTLSQLLSSLRHMSGLEQLTLGLLPKTSEDNELFDKVSLPHLKSIALAGPTIRTIISLFSHLLLPVDVKIALNLAQSVDPQELCDLRPIMDKDVDESVPVIRSMRIIFSSGVFGVQFSTSTVFASEYIWNPHNGHIRFSIQFPCDILSNGNPTIIFDICRMVPHCQIQSLFASFTIHCRNDFLARP